MKRIALATMFVLVGTMAASAAEARTDRLVTYRQEQLWTGLVRFLRVDMGYRILERDKEAGYLLFEYSESGRDRSGSVEMIPVVESGRRHTRIRLQIPSMPTYVEVVLFDRFERKLRSEYGDPPAAEAVDTGKPAATAAEGKPAAAKAEPPEGEDDAELGDDDLEDAAGEEE